MAKIKKAQKGATQKKSNVTQDSTAYYKRQAKIAVGEMSNAKTPVEMSVASNKITAADKNAARQKLKGKPGYDANGFPIKDKIGNRKKGGIVKKAQSGATMPKQEKTFKKTTPSNNVSKMSVSSKKMKMGGKMSKKK